MWDLMPYMHDEWFALITGVSRHCRLPIIFAWVLWVHFIVEKTHVANSYLLAAEYLETDKNTHILDCDDFQYRFCIGLVRHSAPG